MTTWCVPLADVAVADRSLDRRRITVALMRHDYFDADGTWLSAKIADPYPVDIFDTPLDSALVPVLDVWHPNSGVDFEDWINTWLDLDLSDMRTENIRTHVVSTIRRSVHFAPISEDLIHPRVGIRRNRDNDDYWPRSGLLARTLERENILHVAARSGASPDALQAICAGRFVYTSAAAYAALVRATGCSVREVVDDLENHDPHGVACGGDHQH